MDKQGNKTGGRVKGTPNAVTAEVRGMIAEIVKGNMNKVKEDLTKLTPKDRVDAIAKLLPYGVPRMVDANITETTLTPEEAAAAFMALTD
jgi:hypothetical protein